MLQDVPERYEMTSYSREPKDQISSGLERPSARRERLLGLWHMLQDVPESYEVKGFRRKMMLFQCAWTDVEPVMVLCPSTEPAARLDAVHVPSSAFGHRKEGATGGAYVQHSSRTLCMVHDAPQSTGECQLPAMCLGYEARVFSLAVATDDVFWLEARADVDEPALAALHYSVPRGGVSGTLEECCRVNVILGEGRVLHGMLSAAADAACHLLKWLTFHVSLRVGILRGSTPLGCHRVTLPSFPGQSYGDCT